MIDYENRPYLWREAENYPKKGLLEYNWREQNIDDLIFMQAHFIPEQGYDLILRCGIAEEKVKQFDILPNLTVAPIVNQRTIDILSIICPDDFQAFPVIIINHSKIASYENHDYFLINITHDVDSVDRETSYLDIGKDGIDIERIKKLFFKPGCLGERHLARERYFHPLELISLNLVQAFRKAKIKGGRFLKGHEAYHIPFPEEYLAIVFSEKPESAKRYFVSQMNDKESYAFFKTRIPKIPRDILEALIEMTLSRSSFHKEQCEEIREIMETDNK